MRLLLSLLPALCLVACERAATEGAAPEVFTFNCANGQSFTVGYTAASGDAHVNAGGQAYELARAVSGSGARYASEEVEFWERQGEATLTGAAGGPYESCRLG